MQLGDIYYTLFRHKWKILSWTLLGVVAGVSIYNFLPPPFQSEAKLLIRFIISDSSRSIGPGDDTEKKSPDMRGETIINSELQILTSRDLSEIVAKNIGPEKILAAVDGGKSLGEAASLVRTGLTVEVPTRSSTLRLSFQHPDTELVQPILREIVSSYLKRHVEIHRTSSMVNDFLAQETDQLRARLTQTEEELRKLTNKAGVVSLEASKQGFATQQARIRQEIFMAQAELAERNSIHAQMTKGQPVAPAEGEPAPPPATPAQIDAYQKLTTRVGQIQQRIQDVLTQFTEESPAVKQLRVMLNDAEAQKQQMESQHPALTLVRQATPASSNQPPPYDPITEGAKINAIQARIDLLLKQDAQIRTEAFNLDQMEVGILELRRRKELEETNYRNFAASLESSRIREAMGEGKISNIAIVQAPTPPYRDWVPMRKITAIICASGLIIGLVWAFLIEFVLDHTLRRPSDVERLLRMPLFISIPKTYKKSRFRFRWRPGKRAQTGAGPSVPPTPSDQLALPATETSQLEPFHQTLRDRLISFFDSINLQHKPKLIAVTGLRRGAGATTTAAGLARSISETGEGNVLLVDMTQGQGSALHFHRGTPIGLDQLFDTRNSAFVRDNLYVVSEHSGSERLAKGMPQRFNQLVPKLKSSDFDYIIFDMPAVSQISITPRLASFMDLVLLVVESEKTDRALAEQAAALLAQSKTNLGVILNQTISYVPASLHHDREFLLGV